MVTEPVPARPGVLDDLDRLAFADRYWGLGRLAFLAILAGFIILLASYLFEASATRVVAIEWVNQTPLLEGLPIHLLQPPALFVTPRGLRYVLIPPLLLLGALLAGARYVQDVYELNSFRLAVRYLLASLFGLGYPRLVVADGKPKVEIFEENPILRIGGPGNVQVSRGNLVLVERPSGQARVLPVEGNFVNRFETIKEVLDAEVQAGHSEKFTAMTKDGLPVTVKDVRFQYRLKRSRRYRRGGKLGEKTDTITYKELYKAVYKLAVMADGKIDWGQMVRVLIEGAIKAYISKRMLDQLIVPIDSHGNLLADPRGEIHKGLHSLEVRQRLQGIGAELVWIDIGHLSVDKSEIVAQILQAWQAKWTGKASFKLSEGEATRLVELEIARAEAHAEIVRKILVALKELGPPGEARERLHSLVVLRTTQILETLSNNFRPEEGSEEQS